MHNKPTTRQEFERPKGKKKVEQLKTLIIMKVYLLMHTAEIGQDKSTECIGVFLTKEKAQKRLIEEMRNRSTHCDQEYWQTLEKETE